MVVLAIGLLGCGEDAPDKNNDNVNNTNNDNNVNNVNNVNNENNSDCDACDGPLPTCRNGVARYTPAVCENDRCVLKEPVQTVCGDSGRVCGNEGACVTLDTFCSECGERPNRCMDNVLTTFELNCSAENPACEYIETTRDCVAENLICINGDCIVPP